MAGKRKSPSKSKRKGKLPQEVTARRLRKSQANTAQDFVCEEFVINGTVYQPLQCSDCSWTQLATRDKVKDEINSHYQQCQGSAPVRQVEDSEEKVAEDTPNQEVDPKPVDTTQPILQELVTQQVPGTQQPEYRHEQVVVEDHAASQDQVALLSMDGGHRRVCHMACQVECDAEPCPKVRQQYPLWLRWEYCTHKCYCPDCQCQRWDHYDGIHVAPVRQVEDSEDEAACQPTLQIHGLTPVRQVEDSEDEAACQPIQQVHGPAPVRQVEDSEV